jgi:hypothetical protein
MSQKHEPVAVKKVDPKPAPADAKGLPPAAAAKQAKPGDPAPVKAEAAVVAPPAPTPDAPPSAADGDPKPAPAVSSPGNLPHVQVPPDQVEPEPEPEESKSADELKADYDYLVRRVQEADLANRRAEAEIQTRIKAEVAKGVADLGVLKEDKRRAYGAWKKAEEKEQAEKRAEAAKAATGQ